MCATTIQPNWHEIDDRWYHIVPVAGEGVYVDGALVARADGEAVCMPRHFPARVIKVVYDLIRRFF